MLDGELLPHGRQVDFTELAPERWTPGFATPFNQRMIRGKVLITNDFGDWLLLTPDEFRSFIEGGPQPGEPLYEKLREANFIAKDMDVRAQAERWRRKKQYLFHGPTLHGLVLTHRCNHGCQYCHSSVVGMERTDTDMSFEVAERAVDVAFQSTAWGITIEFQGGEPTANWDVLRHVVEYATRKNQDVGKILSFALVTNLSLMDDDRLAFLLDNKVQICTSLDGPADLHNKIRIFKNGNSHELLVQWMKKINERYREMGLDTNHYRVEALHAHGRASPRLASSTSSSRSAAAPSSSVLDPFGFAAKSIRPSATDGRPEFYANAADYIIELNRQGVQVMERHAVIAEQDPDRRGAQLSRPPTPAAHVSSSNTPDGGRLPSTMTLRRTDGRHYVQDGTAR
jgi:hypothetical protein